MTDNVKLKILVFGSEGMAGNTIATFLADQGHNVTGFSRKPRLFMNSIMGDVEDISTVEHIVQSGNYNTIINCVGILNQDAEERRDKAVYLNSYFPHKLVSLTQGTETQIIHMSTDCVFSGCRGSYTENDFPDGETFYDRTKALGEINDHKNLTLRNSIIGPDIKSEGIGLFNWFMKQNGPIKGYSEALWTGLTTVELAKVMEKAAVEKTSGLINMVHANPITKLELLRLFNKYFKGDKIVIESSDDIVIDKSLVRTNFNLDYIVPDYETMISEMAQWMSKHKEKYPHYNL